jgi:thymidylate synthase
MKNIPVLQVRGKSLAEAYEKALIALHAHGIPMATQYDKPGDPLSLDATMNITILEPWSDPMIHKAFPGGIEDLREYVMEVMGAKDHWVKNMNDPEDTRWEYTYHGRLAAYGTWRERRDGASEVVGDFQVDQIEKVIDKLVSRPYTRQAQMITWMPNAFVPTTPGGPTS